MKITTIVSDILECNMHLFCLSGHTVMIDCGGTPQNTKKQLLEVGLWPDIILLTHGHYDHISSLSLFEGTDTQIFISSDEKIFLNDPILNLSTMISGVPFIYRGKVYTLSELPPKLNLTFFHSPGHTEGSYCYQCDNVLFTGDTLFCAGIGAIHFPTGNVNREKDSLRKIFTLPRNTLVYSGHGDITTVGAESDRYLKFL